MKLKCTFLVQSKNRSLKKEKFMQKQQAIPTFTKGNMSIRNNTYKLKRKISRLVMATELQYKHQEKRKLRKNTQSINVLLSTSLSA